MYVNWLFFSLFLFPPKKKGGRGKENELAKPVLSKFFLVIHSISPFLKHSSFYYKRSNTCGSERAKY